MPRASSSRRAVTVVVAALAAVLALPAPASAAACPEGVGVGLLGAARGDDPRSASYVVDAVEAGDSFSRRVQVCNGTDEDVTVELYTGAAVVEDGVFRVLEGRPRSELTSWVRVEPGRVTIPARQAAVVTARFDVPDDADDGERYGALLVALPPRDGGGVQVVSRVGVRVYLAVGDGSRSTDFTVRSLQAVRGEDGRPALRALVRNTGRRAVDPTGSLALTDGPAGTRAGPFPVSVGTTIAPGAEAPVLVPLDRGLSAGPWRAELTLRAGGVERRSAATVRWPAVGEGISVPARELEGHGSAVRLAVALVLVLAAVVLGLLLVARRRRTDEARPVPPTVPATGTALPPPAVPTPGVPPLTVPAAAPLPVSAPRPVPVPAPGGVPVAGSAAVHPPLPVLPAPRNAAVRRALAQRAAGAAAAAAAEAP